MKQALIVVDLQQGLFAQAPFPHQIDEVIVRVNALAARARQAGVPVVFVQHADEELVPGSEAWQIDPRLEVLPSDLKITKTSSAPYASSNLHEWLQQQGVQALVIAGYSTEFCIDSTVRFSASLGYPVTLVSDAHTCHDKPHLSGEQIIRHHNATLPRMDSLGAPVRTSLAAALWA